MSRLKTYHKSHIEHVQPFDSTCFELPWPPALAPPVVRFSVVEAEGALRVWLQLRKKKSQKPVHQLL